MARIIHAVLDGNIEGDAEEHALKHAKRLIKMIDEDGDGTLTEQEFLRVICKKVVSGRKYYLQGCLSEPELKQTLEKIVEGCKPPLYTQASYY